MENQFLSQSVNLDGQTIEGPLEGINTLGDLVSQVLRFLLPLGGIVLLLVLIWGGYDYMMSQGNPEKLKSAQAKITTGLIGFALLVFSYLIVRLLSTIFGLGGGIL